MLIVDASSAVNYVVSKRSGRVSAGVRQFESLAPNEMRIAPELYISEVANVYWKIARREGLTSAEARALFGETLSLVDGYEPMMTIAATALELAVRFNHPAYDLFYVALAIETNSELVTSDSRMASIAEEAGAIARLIAFAEAA